MNLCKFFEWNGGETDPFRVNGLGTCDKPATCSVDVKNRKSVWLCAEHFDMWMGYRQQYLELHKQAKSSIASLR